MVQIKRPSQVPVENTNLGWKQLCDEWKSYSVYLYNKYKRPDLESLSNDELWGLIQKLENELNTLQVTFENRPK